MHGMHVGARLVLDTGGGGRRGGTSGRTAMPKSTYNIQQLGLPCRKSGWPRGRGGTPARRCHTAAPLPPGSRQRLRVPSREGQHDFKVQVAAAARLPAGSHQQLRVEGERPAVCCRVVPGLKSRRRRRHQQPGINARSSSATTAQRQVPAGCHSHERKDLVEAYSTLKGLGIMAAAAGGGWVGHSA